MSLDFLCECDIFSTTSLWRAPRRIPFPPFHPFMQEDTPQQITAAIHSWLKLRVATFRVPIGAKKKRLLAKPLFPNLR